MPSVYENAVAEGLTAFNVNARDTRTANSFRAAGAHASDVLETTRKVRLRLVDMLSGITGDPIAIKAHQSGEKTNGANVMPSVLVGVARPLSDLDAELYAINEIIDQINEQIG